MVYHSLVRLSADLYTASLSQRTFAEPLKGIPNICDLYHSNTTIFVAILNATISDLKVDDSTLFCLFKNYIIGAILQKIIMPACDLWVAKLTPWLAITKLLILIGFGFETPITFLAQYHVYIS